MRTFAVDFPSGHVTPRHAHPADQLVYASRGALTVQTDQGAWVIPPERAVWLPAGTVHVVTTTGSVSMRTLYFAPHVARAAPRACRVLRVSPLLRELVLHVCALGLVDLERPAHRRLIEVIVDLLSDLPVGPLQLPEPSDPRAVAVARLLRDDPGRRSTRSPARPPRHGGPSSDSSSGKPG